MIFTGTISTGNIRHCGVRTSFEADTGSGDINGKMIPSVFVCVLLQKTGYRRTSGQKVQQERIQEFDSSNLVPEFNRWEIETPTGRL